MRPFPIAPTLFLAGMIAVMLMPERSQAQNPQQVPMPPGGFKPPPAAPIKPYKPIAATPPGPYSDPAFVAFRKQLADVAQRKDRAGLTKLVVAQGFFWMQDKDLADKRKPPIANLASALNLDAKDGSGWAALAAYADDPTAAPLPDHQGVICAPADPNLDSQAFQAILQATQTEPPDWGYATRDGVEVRAAPKPNAPVIEKLGLTLVRVLPDTGPPEDANQQPFLHIATPSGKAGFVPMDAVAGLGSDQMCYAKDASGWKITGYFGGATQ
jgi:hypothetical protein